MKFAIPAGSLAAAALLISLAPALDSHAQATQPATPPVTAAATDSATPAATMAATMSAPDTSAPTLAATSPATAAPTSAMMRLTLPCTLSAADCQLFDDARSNLVKETSFAQNFTFSALVSGDHPINVQATGSGAFSLDTTALTGSMDRAALLKALQLSLDVNGSASYGTIQQSGRTGIVVKDGVVYGLDPINANWIGVDLSKMMAMRPPSTQPLMPSNPMNPVNPMNPMMNPNNAMTQQLMADPDFQSGITALLSIKGFITQTRLANDAMLEGQPMAQLQDVIAPQVLFNSPDALPAWRSLLKAAANLNPQNRQMGRLDTLNDQQLGGLLKIVGGVFGDTTLTQTYWIGLTDRLFHALTIDVKLNINANPMGTMGAFGGARATNGMMSALNGTINFSVQLTKVGQPVSVTAPASPTMINPMQAMRGFGMGMGNGVPQPYGIRPTRMPRATAQPTLDATMQPTMPAISAPTESATAAATPAAY